MIVLMVRIGVSDCRSLQTEDG